MRELALVALGGAVGAVTRYCVSSWIQKVSAVQFPYGTLVVNVTGCFLLGLLMELINSHQGVSPALRPLLGIGFLGAMTTFSTFGYETVRCFQQSVVSGAGNIGLNVIVGLVAVMIGVAVARIFVR